MKSVWRKLEKLPIGFNQTVKILRSLTQKQDTAVPDSTDKVGSPLYEQLQKHRQKESNCSEMLN